MSARSKTWGISIAAVALALLLGYQLGRWGASPDRDAAAESPAAPGTEGEKRGSAGGDGADQPADLREQNEALTEQVARLQAKLLVQGIAADKAAEEPARRDKFAPMEWPENTPADYGPQDFERLFRKIADEAKAEVDLAGIHCDEPPCLVVRRVPPVEKEEGWWELMKPLQDTATWKDHFPQGIGHQGTKAQCADDRTETVQIIWLTPDEWDEHFVDDMLARRWIRVREILDGWECLPAE
jgi:hypothetical protein